jgi:hypothetical protein
LAEIEVQASYGEPYMISRDNRGLVRLKRHTTAGRGLTVVFSESDAISVSDALVDILETE